MSEDRASYGIVTIELDGDELELKPTLRAFQKIQNRFGGLSQAIQGLSGLNIDNVAAVVAAGAGINGTKDTEKLKEQIFAAGVVNVIGKASEYLALLMNPTGKETAGQEDDDDDMEK